MATNRSDIHRPGAIIPANYSYVRSYNLSTSQDGWPIPSWGVNCELDYRHEVDGKIVNGKHQDSGMCCVLRMRQTQKFVETGSTGRCSICSTHYIYGDIWRHTPTGLLLHVGHDCADKYQMLADRSEWDLAIMRLRRSAATEQLKALKASERAKFLAEHPGLEEALKLDHPILKDMAGRFTQWCDLSEKQIEFAFKLADEVRNPPAAEKKAPAPEGDGLTVKGKVISLKTQDGFYGTTLRMTVKVDTPDGIWLAWGTCPAQLDGDVKGREIEFTANFRHGADPSFAFFSRPRKAKVLDEVTA